MVFSSSGQQPLTLRENIVETIRNMIYEKELMPGSPIREMELTKQLGVSRTPVREAFILLERDGLVVNHPNRGIYVREFNEQDISEIFTVRVTLENLAARLVLDKLDERHFAELEILIQQQKLAVDHEDYRQLGLLDWRFHFFFVELSGNSRLITYWKSIAAQYQAVIRYRATAYPDYDEHQILLDHQWILDAYRSGDLAKVFEANQKINERVAMQSTEGWRLQQLEMVTEG